MRMRMRMGMGMGMKMRLAFLLLVAAASCLNQTGHDPGEDSRQNSRDLWDSPRDSYWNSSRDSPRDLRDSPRDSPRDFRRDSPRDSSRDFRRDLRDSPRDLRDSPRDSPRDFRRDLRDSSRDSPRDSSRDSRRDSPRDFRRDLRDSPRDLRDSPRDSPRDFRRDLRDSSRDSPRDSSRDSRRGSRRRSGTAAPRLLPAPLLLRLPPEPGPPRIRCLAPRRFPGSTFELLRGLPALPVRSLLAAPDRHWAEFALPGAAGCFRCRYRSHNGSAWLESELSTGTGGSDLSDAECQPSTSTGTAAGPAPTAGTPWNDTGTLRNSTGTPWNGTRTLRNDPPWLLPVSVGVAVPGLLLLLGAATVAGRGLRRRRGQSHTVPAPSFPLAPAPASPSP